MVRMELTGTLSTEEVLACVDDAAQTIGSRQGFRLLSDHRGLDTPATPSQIQALVMRIGSHGDALSGLRWAIVTVMAASQGMMGQLARYASTVGVQVGVFRDMQEAEQWLGPSGEEGSA